MSTIETNALTAFQWERQPAAEQLVRDLVNDFLARNRWAAAFAERLYREAGVRFVDMVDHIAIPGCQDLPARLIDAGFRGETIYEGGQSYTHAGGMFPTVIVDEGERVRLAIKVESVADFAAANDIPLLSAELPLSVFRKTFVPSDNEDAELWAVERHGTRVFWSVNQTRDERILRAKHAERFRTRRRRFESEADGFSRALELIDASIGELGVDQTCDLFFAAEREYWMKRNTAARVQKARQDRLGIGWANHDHHTYRSSREHFKSLVGVWEKLGLVCRERFYAGKEAGWGAQVMEQPVTGIITFNDVDLSPEELMGDFSHDGLAPREKLGTVGLWCALHGEAFNQAGMHHLEAQFDFDALRDQLAAEGVETMKPFTDFPFLRQAFTKGERWAVDESRIQRALAARYITPDQARQFRDQGALGSHLENLERNEGFKGFNQTGVSEIIAETDPRRHVATT